MQYHQSTGVLFKEYLSPFPNKDYEQLEGTATGSPMSPIVTDLFMECFETKTLNTSSKPPSLWLRCVDGTFVVQMTSHKSEFLKHINLLESNNQLTVEETRPDRSMPFLDTLVIPQTNGILETTVYRKSNHTYLYLQWNSHHTITAKYSAISILFDRPKLHVQTNSNYFETKYIYKRCYKNANIPCGP